jgi:hypothetical protein
MLRFPLLVLVALWLALSAPAHAGGGAAKPAGGENYLELAPTALPVIVNGKVKNYVFVQLRLLPGPGADMIKLREVEPYYRDALVRAAHRAPFNSPSNWVALDEARLRTVLLAEARRISGPRNFSGVQVVRQTPRRRTGMAGVR